MLQSVRVRNFKAIADATVNLTPLHLLIGPNNSGKTSLLEAIAALSRSLDHTIDKTFLGRWTGRQLVHSSATEPVAVIEGFLEGKLSGSYKLQCEFPETGKKVVVQEATWNDGEEKNIAIGKEATLTGFSVPSSAKERQWYDEAVELSSVLCPCWYLRWSARNLALPATLQPERFLRLAGNGFGLPTLLDDIQNHSQDLFSKISTDLRKQFPEVYSLRLKQERAYDSPFDDPEQTLTLKLGNGKQLYFVMKNGAEIPAPQIAEGILYVLAYLAILNLPEPPKILLVEEPENGIHPARVCEVVKLLRKITEVHSGIQIIMASHSPYLVDEMKPNEVTWCQRQDGNVVTENLDKNETVQRQLGMFELGEIWSNYLDPIGGVVSD